MKVVCIDVAGYKDITIGKIYNCHRYSTNYYYIKNDLNDSCTYPKRLFMTIEESRNKKLEELGI